MALETEADLVALADGLTQSADVIHARLTKALQDHQTDQATAQRIFQEEGVLRQRANALYLDAASRVMAGLQPAQASLLDLMTAANDRIASAKDVSLGLALIADLLALAAAAGTAKARPILAALQALRKDVEEASRDMTTSRGSALPRAER